MSKAKIAIIDDYQKIALKSADWSSLDADIEVFHEPWRSEDHLVETLAGFDIISLLRERTPFPARVLERLPNLRLISLTGHRTSTLDVDACSRRGIVVTFTTSPKSEATAELAVGLMIACARAIPMADGKMRAGQFQEGLPIGRSLSGKRLGVLGLGKLGSRVAAVGLALGMDVVAWSKNLTEGSAKTKGVQRVNKDELFATSDVVTIHLALSERTRGIVGLKEIALLKDGAILINTARASLVDEDAMLGRLEQGTISAGLDVYSIEPLPADHRFRGLPNVVLTPHLGYVVGDVFSQFFKDSRDNIASYLAGKPINVLNP
jgi:phosphoglycerate dehydrogenase-like enzyme